MAKSKPVYQDPLAHHHDDEPAAPYVSPLRVMLALLLASLMLAALNSESLTGYLEGLEPNLVSEAIMPLAYGWNELMQSLGVTQINQAIRDFIMTLHDYSPLSQ